MPSYELKHTGIAVGMAFAKRIIMMNYELNNQRLGCSRWER